MYNKEKIALVEELKEAFKENKGILFTDHSGLKVEDAVSIRDKLVENNSYLKIVKNTLALIAAKEAIGDIDLSEIFKGPTSMIICKEDIISTAKIIKEFAGENETLVLKGGIMENRVLDSERVKMIASLPGREVLLGQLLMGLKSPLYNLVNVLGSFTRNLVLVLNAVKGKKESISN